MLKQLKPLTVFWDNNLTFTDYTNESLSYGRDTMSFAALSETEDYIYFGTYKPINGIYVEQSTANASTTTFDVEFYNGTVWTDVDGDIDDTRGFSRSGYIRWKPNQTDQAKVTINSIEEFFFRMRPAAAFDAGQAVAGISIVYSDDQDLSDEIPSTTLTNYREANENSYILRHQSARDDIIQDIRNSGKFKFNNVEGLVRQIDIWDFQDIEEIRQWSKYLVLSKIFENLSKNEDDIFWSRSQQYMKKASQAGNLYYATLDLDDDGILDVEERLASNFKSASIIRR